MKDIRGAPVSTNVFGLSLGHWDLTTVWYLSDGAAELNKPEKRRTMPKQSVFPRDINMDCFWSIRQGNGLSFGGCEVAVLVT